MAGKYSLMAKPGIKIQHRQAKLVSAEEYDLACRFQSSGLKGVPYESGVCFVYGKSPKEICVLERAIPGIAEGKPLNVRFLLTEDELLKIMAGGGGPDEGALEKTLFLMETIKKIAASAELPIKHH